MTIKTLNLGKRTGTYIKLTGPHTAVSWPVNWPKYGHKMDIDFGSDGS